MSKITQDFITNLGSLYEEIHTKDANFLNEESEFFDEEAAELAEDIILSISLSMFSEGYTAETLIKFLVHSDEQTILEKYLMSDVSEISEEVIFEEFIEEQLEIIEGVLSLLAKGAGAVAKLARGGKSLIRKGVEKAATAGVDSRIGKQLAKSTDLSRTELALAKTATNKATKAGITVPQGALSPKQSGDLIKQARISKAISGVKTAGKTALAAGVGAGAVYALKPGGVEGGAKPSPSSTTAPPAPVLPPPSGSTGSSTGSGSSGSGSSRNGGSSSGGQVISATDGKGGKVTVGKQYTATLGGEAGTVTYDKSGNKTFTAGKKTWAAANPKLAVADAERERIRGTSATDNPLMKDFRQNLPAPTTSQSPEVSKLGKGYQSLTQNPNANATTDLYTKLSNISLGSSQFKPSVGSEVAATNVASADPLSGKTPLRPAEAPKTPTEVTSNNKKNKVPAAAVSESFDAYDLILEYLFENGHADTLDEAHYLMLEMDTDAISNIFEAKYGTKEGRHKLGLKIAHGKDVGKKGAGFEKIVNKASKKYGKKRATKIAAAAMWKNLG